MGPSIKYVRKIFRKTNISTPLIRTRTSAYQGIRNISFSETFAYVLNGWPLGRNSNIVLKINMYCSVTCHEVLGLVLEVLERLWATGSAFWKYHTEQVRGHSFMTSTKMTNFLTFLPPPSAKMNNISIADVINVWSLIRKRISNMLKTVWRYFYHKFTFERYFSCLENIVGESKI